MESIRVRVGSETSTSSGAYRDLTQMAEFTGEKIGSWCDGLDDSRGVEETLYKAEDGRLVVHVRQWSNWQGESTRYHLQPIEQADLEPGGSFEFLGAAAGMSRPMTLDEACAIEN